MREIDSLIAFLKRSLVVNQPLILFSIIIIGGLGILSRVQYFNLLFSEEVIFIFYWTLVIILFGLPPKITFLLGIIFFFFSLVFFLLNLNELAERAGNIIYFLLVIGVLQNAVLHFNEMNSKK